MRNPQNSANTLVSSDAAAFQNSLGVGMAQRVDIKPLPMLDGPHISYGKSNPVMIDGKPKPKPPKNIGRMNYETGEVVVRGVFARSNKPTHDGKPLPPPPPKRSRAQVIAYSESGGNLLSGGCNVSPGSVSQRVLDVSGGTCPQGRPNRPMNPPPNPPLPRPKGSRK